jgi:hypothetical protein
LTSRAARGSQHHATAGALKHAQLALEGEVEAADVAANTPPIGTRGTAPAGTVHMQQHALTHSSCAVYSAALECATPRHDANKRVSGNAEWPVTPHEPALHRVCTCSTTLRGM